MIIKLKLNKLTHAILPPEISKAGFTLAEVLITLGIIGVVAAMTIPTLIANTKSQQYRAQLKKTVSTLSQAARLSQSQYGFDYAGINQPCSNNGGSEHPDNVMSICSILNGSLTGATFYSKATDIKMNKKGSQQNYTIENGYFFNAQAEPLSSYMAYVLADGTIVGFIKVLGQNNGCSLKIGTAVRTEDAGDNGTSMCYGFIDVNGTNLPNKEVSCSVGSESLKQNKTCIVKNDAKHLTDIYPIRFHDGIVEPATAAAKYVLNSTK